MAYTAEQKRKAIQRELAYRIHVYPRRIEAGKMTQQLANEQIAIFEAILEDYRKAEEGERLI